MRQSVVHISLICMGVCNTGENVKSHSIAIVPMIHVIVYAIMYDNVDQICAMYYNITCIANCSCVQ